LFKKWIYLPATLVVAAFLILTCLVVSVHEWRVAAGRFIFRTWNELIGANSTSNLGFLLGSLVIPLLAGLLGFSYSRWLRKETWKAAFHSSIMQAVLTVLAVVIAESAVFIFFSVRGMYNDHAALIKRNEELTGKLNTANAEIAKRQQQIYFRDPAMGNLRSLLMDFDMYRHAQKGRPCVLYLTETTNTDPSVASQVAQFSNPISDCFTFGPVGGPIGYNPDLEKIALDGMVPDAIVFHMDRNDKAAFTLAGQLGSLLPLRISYAPLPNRKVLYALPPNIAGKETLIWLQFGTNVKWNSERWAAKKSN